MRHTPGSLVDVVILLLCLQLTPNAFDSRNDTFWQWAIAYTLQITNQYVLVSISKFASPPLLVNSPDDLRLLARTQDNAVSLLQRRMEHGPSQCCLNRADPHLTCRLRELLLRRVQWLFGVDFVHVLSNPVVSSETRSLRRA